MGAAAPLTEDDAEVEAPPPTLEALFVEHAERVRGLIWRLLGPGATREDVEDLGQQVFVAVHRALPRFRQESQVGTWLYGITARTVYRELRDRSRHRRMLGRLNELALAAARDGGQGAMESRPELTRVWRHLLGISAKKRLVFVLHEVEGLSGPEIAAMLDINEATVHSRLYHARRELVRALEGP